jgi:hypothetical protein
MFLFGTFRATEHKLTVDMVLIMARYSLRAKVYILLRVQCELPPQYKYPISIKYSETIRLRVPLS